MGANNRSLFSLILLASTCIGSPLFPTTHAWITSNEQDGETVVIDTGDTLPLVQMAISGPGVEVNGGKLVFDGSAGGASVSINPVAISDAAATWFAIDFWLQPVALQTSSLQRILVLTTSSISFYVQIGSNGDLSVISINFSGAETLKVIKSDIDICVSNECHIGYRSQTLPIGNGPSGLQHAIFLNGEKVAEGFLNGKFQYPGTTYNTKAFVGTLDGASDGAYSGTMRDLRMFDIELSDLQMTQLFDIDATDSPTAVPTVNPTPAPTPPTPSPTAYCSTVACGQFAACIPYVEVEASADTWVKNYGATGPYGADPRLDFTQNQDTRAYVEFEDLLVAEINSVLAVAPVVELKLVQYVDSPLPVNFNTLFPRIDVSYLTSNFSEASTIYSNRPSSTATAGTQSLLMSKPEGAVILKGYEEYTDISPIKANISSFGLMFKASVLGSGQNLFKFASREFGESGYAPAIRMSGAGIFTCRCTGENGTQGLDAYSTAALCEAPTQSPSLTLTALPTVDPTPNPTTVNPTTVNPTTANPTTTNPTTVNPTNQPTADPTTNPTTSNPTEHPTVNPTTANPTTTPSLNPSTANPTGNPTTENPTLSPSTVTSPAPTPAFLEDFGSGACVDQGGNAYNVYFSSFSQGAMHTLQQCSDVCLANLPVCRGVNHVASANLCAIHLDDQYGGAFASGTPAGFDFQSYLALAPTQALPGIGPIMSTEPNAQAGICYRVNGGGPAMLPTLAPTSLPTFAPTSIPTVIPTVNPTTANPTTTNPTTVNPTNQPTADPTTNPTTPNPTEHPTANPTTANPTTNPTTVNPTTANPTPGPTRNPTTNNPSTANPTANPTTANPTPAGATSNPSLNPTTNNPSTANPTANPTLNPSTSNPTTAEDTINPTLSPTAPTSTATSNPTTANPTSSPTGNPTSTNSTRNPTTSNPTANVGATTNPTISPSTANPSATPATASPSKSPTPAETTTSPSISPTSSPTESNGGDSGKLGGGDGGGTEGEGLRGWVAPFIVIVVVAPLLLCLGVFLCRKYVSNYWQEKNWKPNYMERFSSTQAASPGEVEMEGMADAEIALPEHGDEQPDVSVEDSSEDPHDTLGNESDKEYLDV